MNTQTISSPFTSEETAFATNGNGAALRRRARNWRINLDLVKPSPASFARFLGLALVIYFLGVPQIKPLLALPFITFFIYGAVVDQRLVEKSYFWVITTALLLMNMYFSYYAAANHHFLLVYFAIVLALVFLYPKEEQNDFLVKNVRWIMVIMFFFVTFQKAVSPTYVDGSFFAYLTVKGGLFGIFQGVIPGFESMVDANRELLLGFPAINPHEQTSVALAIEEPILFKIYNIAVSYSVLLFEGLTMLGLLIFSKGKLRHFFLLATIIGVAVSRGEGGYLSLLCAAGFVLCTDDAKIFRPAYILCFVLISGFIFINWMFH